MSNHVVRSKLPGAATSTDNLTNDRDNQEDRLEAPKVITDPNAEVHGLTIAQWSEVWIRTMVNAPEGAVDSLNDPNGTVAAAINNPHSPMYFITGAPSGNRTFDVHHGQDVFVPIGGVTDAEGPNIPPSLDAKHGGPFGGPGEPSFADEVQKVLNAVKFANVTLTVDSKPITNLAETKTGIFSAGVAQPGSEATDFFGAAPGASLATTGQVGYFAVLDDLSRGTHMISSTVTITDIFGHTVTQSHTDNIRVT
jgi:hypothetical protein